MKNLVQGQEISIYKEFRGLSFVRFIKKENDDFRDGCLGFIIIIIFFITCIIVDDFFNEYYNDFFNFKINNNFFFFILRSILFLLSGVLPLGLLYYIFSFYLNIGNPSIIYFNDCLVVETQGFRREGIPYFKGDIPFKMIKRFVLKGKREVIIVLEKNNDFFRSEDYFKGFDGELTFELKRELQKVSLQIVEELNSKLIKE